MNEIKAPNKYSIRVGVPCVFLGGSIELGKAIDWQSELKDKLAMHDVTLLNPRRDDWDPTIELSINNPQFKEQVDWELDALEYADLIVFNFDPNTKSPITLMELGLYAHCGKRVIVCCPEPFWRRANVEIVCQRYGVRFVNDLNEVAKYIEAYCDSIPK